jgi:hypothetical protein
MVDPSLLRPRSILPALLLAVGAVAAQARPTPPPPQIAAPTALADDALLAGCRDRVARALPPPAREILPRIQGLGGQLLALRSYLRARDLAARWSWTDAQIAAWQGSAAQRAAFDAVARVQRAFADRNPGFMVYANLQVRSLEVQLGRWNANASVLAAADALLPAARAACTASLARRTPGFADWLLAWKPPAPPTLAAPGLSPHGQGRAFDFQVQKPDPVLVAGTDARRMQADWREGGWEAKLADAVRASGTPFTGPLRSPDEPWHYAFTPAPADAAVASFTGLPTATATPLPATRPASSAARAPPQHRDR